MKRVYAGLVAVIAMVCIMGCSKGPASGKVLVEVNGEEITEGNIDFLGEINPRIQSQLASPSGKKRILDNLVDQTLLYQRAIKDGINRDPLVKAKVDLYRKVIIAQSLVEAEIEKAAKQYYDEHPDEFKKLALSQIEVKFATPTMKGKEKLPSEADALKLVKELKAKIEGGEAFADVAKASSDDVATKTRGGDMGLIAKDDRRFKARGWEPLVEKAFEMKVGEVSGPIKTSSGYHLITVTRGLELEPFDEAKQSILFKVRGDARQELLASLKEDSKIVYPEEAAKKKAAEEAMKKAEAAKEAAKGEVEETTVEEEVVVEEVPAEKEKAPAAEEKMEKPESAEQASE